MCCTRVDQVDGEILDYMKRAGVEWIFYGVESGNQEILKRCNKNVSLNQIKRAFYLTKKAGIGTHAGIILGHLGETRRSALDTIRFLRELMPDYSGIATLIPFPGSKTWDYCNEKNIPLPENWNDYGMVNAVPIAVNPDLTSKELLKLRDRAILEYYGNPRRLWRSLRNKRYNRKLIIRDHIYNAYALLHRKVQQNREIRQCSLK
jgi:anaerobic magnesium-protoporphyrin IX monomethyl ester cyclase